MLGYWKRRALEAEEKATRAAIGGAILERWWRQDEAKAAGRAATIRRLLEEVRLCDEIIRDLGLSYVNEQKRADRIANERQGIYEAGMAAVERADKAEAERDAALARIEEIQRLRVFAENRVAKLRQRLRDQTHQTQITGNQIIDRVHDVLTQKGVVPDGITLAEHPVEQNVATCLSRLIAERDAALESLHTIAERFGEVARLLDELRKAE